MVSHSVTCHPAEVTFPPLPQPKLVLDLATPEGCKAELYRRSVAGGDLSTVNDKRKSSYQVDRLLLGRRAVHAFHSPASDRLTDLPIGATDSAFLRQLTLLSRIA